MLGSFANRVCLKRILCIVKMLKLKIKGVFANCRIDRNGEVNLD